MDGWMDDCAGCLMDDFPGCSVINRPPGVSKSSFCSSMCPPLKHLLFTVKVNFFQSAGDQHLSFKFYFLFAPALNSAHPSAALHPGPPPAAESSLWGLERISVISGHQLLLLPPLAALCQRSGERRSAEGALPPAGDWCPPEMSGLTGSHIQTHLKTSSAMLEAGCSKWNDPSGSKHQGSNSVIQED